MMTDKEIWIFGYGSLMWQPGFEVVESQLAVLSGYHRDLCILSYVFRGTPEVPGLVMGLNPGGTCHGRAFRIQPEQKKQVMAYLHEREMINNVYEPSWLDVRLADGRCLSAYSFVAVQDHDQFVGHFNDEKKVDYILQGIGSGGTSLEYLENTCAHLRALSIDDPGLEALLSAAKAKKQQKS
ncbi:MAG: gamma-glutamylcyclotransferase [Methylocystaceae bacterium]|nr:gamma-glutamylcyclotransferase [Methylocystaceae bacterium]